MLMKIITNKTDTSDSISLAEQVAESTRRLLDTQGWCLWKCSALDGKNIAILRDKTVRGAPQDIPIYTEEELLELCQESTSQASLRFIYQIKKQGATITGSRRKTHRVLAHQTKFG
jgi:hypothetical protein